MLEKALGDGLLETLWALPLFAGLSEEDLRWVVAHLTEDPREAHEVVCAEGAPATTLWIILSDSW